MFEANVNVEADNELIENLTIATLESLMIATLDGITTNKRERTAYTAGFLAAISIFTDTATSMEILKGMSDKE